VQLNDEGNKNKFDVSAGNTFSFIKVVHYVGTNHHVFNCRIYSTSIKWKRPWSSQKKGQKLQDDRIQAKKTAKLSTTPTIVAVVSEVAGTADNKNDEFA
jgi:hypothetical protein